MALSSGETNLGGICRGTAIAPGLQSLAKDLGIHLKLDILTDAIASVDAEGLAKSSIYTLPTFGSKTD